MDAGAAQAGLLFQKPEPAARATLERLVESGLIEAQGDRRRTYHLSAAAYRERGHPAAHTRVRSFEPIQQEQMILQYVDAHRRITRGEAIELCRNEPRETTRMLKRLVQRGDLRQRGNRRGTFYERPTLISMTPRSYLITIGHRNVIRGHTRPL